MAGYFGEAEKTVAAVMLGNISKRLRKRFLFQDIVPRRPTHESNDRSKLSELLTAPLTAPFCSDPLAQLIPCCSLQERYGANGGLLR
jgi:hypothetical protein